MYMKSIVSIPLLFVVTGCALKNHSVGSVVNSGEAKEMQVISAKREEVKQKNERYVYMWIAEDYRASEGANDNHSLLLISK